MHAFPFLFLVDMDFLMKKSTSNPQYDIRWQTGRLWVISNSQDSMQHMTDDLNDNASKVGLRISCEKTKVTSIGVISAPQIHVKDNNRWSALQNS